MAKSGCRMGIDRDLRDLAGRELVGALYFERGGSGLDLEPTGQRRRNQCRGDFLMDLDDTLAEQVFDQMEDRAGVTLQKAADGGKFPVDVNLGPADRKFVPVSVTKAADCEPILAACDPGPG